MSDPELFWNLGHKITGHNICQSRAIGHRRFRSFFGVSPLVASACWDLLEGKIPTGAKPVHLLWALCFLKKYDTESGNRGIMHVDEKTYRKWVWILVELLSELDVVDIKSCNFFL